MFTEAQIQIRERNAFIEGASRGNFLSALEVLKLADEKYPMPKVEWTPEIVEAMRICQTREIKGETMAYGAMNYERVTF